MTPEELGLEPPFGWGVFSIAKTTDRPSQATQASTKGLIVPLSKSDDLSVKAAFEEFDRLFGDANQR